MTTESAVMRPDVLTRVCLVVAAVLPWYAMASGVVGLYFYTLVLAGWVRDFIGKNLRGGGAYEEAIADALVTSILLVSLPLGGLLLFVMPSGLLWAVVKYGSGGWAGLVTRVGCLVSMALAALYAALLLVGLVMDLSQGGTGDLWWTGWIHTVVLLAGLAATWRALWWLNWSQVVGSRDG